MDARTIDGLRRRAVTFADDEEPMALASEVTRLLDEREALLAALMLCLDGIEELDTNKKEEGATLARVAIAKAEEP